MFVAGLTSHTSNLAPLPHPLITFSGTQVKSVCSPWTARRRVTVEVTVCPADLKHSSRSWTRWTAARSRITPVSKALRKILLVHWSRHQSPLSHSPSRSPRCSHLTPTSLSLSLLTSPETASSHPLLRMSPVLFPGPHPLLGQNLPLWRMLD